MKVFKVTHSISAMLDITETEKCRYFSNIESANDVFNSLLELIDYSNDEWISLWSVDVKCENGEFKSSDEKQIRYFSDDTKVGVDFCYVDHEKELVDSICDALTKWSSGNYNPFDFYCTINGKSDEGNEIARAMDAGTNEDVVNAIACFLRSHYRPSSEILHFLLKQIDISWV